MKKNFKKIVQILCFSWMSIVQAKTDPFFLINTFSSKQDLAERTQKNLHKILDHIDFKNEINEKKSLMSFQEFLSSISKNKIQKNMIFLKKEIIEIYFIWKNSAKKNDY